MPDGQRRMKHIGANCWQRFPIKNRIFVDGIPEMTIDLDQFFHTGYVIDLCDRDDHVLPGRISESAGTAGTRKKSMQETS